MLRWFLIGLMSLTLTVVIPAVINISSMDIVPLTVLAAETPQVLLQQGLAHYEAEQYSDAVQQWQRASLAFDRQADIWGQALSLSYLALAQQELGHLDQAGQTLQASLKLFEAVDPETYSSTQAVIYAKVLNAQGKLLWRETEVEAALEAWQRSAKAYGQAGDGTGVAIAQINQARVFQYLGLNHQAKAVLQDIYQRLQQQPDADLKATGLYRLSSVLRQIGDLETAQIVLQESLSLTTQPKTTSNLLLELGNTEWAMASRASAIGRQTQTQQHIQSAQKAYEQAIDINNTPLAQLNLFRLWVEQNQIDRALATLPRVNQAIAQLPTSRAAIHAYIHLAESLIKVHTLPTRFTHAKEINNQSTVLQPKDIAELLSTALTQARSLKDKRAEAYVLGRLGTLYEQTQQWTDAQTLTQQALLNLETVQAPEIRYLWEWQLGRLQQQKNDRSGAIRSYQEAIGSLQQVRNNLLSSNTDVQFSFRDNVEPVYRQYIKLLLSEQGPDSQGLKKAIQTVDQLQLAELENYLGCTLDASQLEQVQDAQTAIIYPIILSDRIAIIAQFPGATATPVYRETPVPQATAETTLLSLQANLANPSKTPDVLANAQTIYNWLIRPLEKELEQTSAKTLVFMPDGALRNIPMAVLHDGEQYLIEKGYAVAIAPRLQLFTPQPDNPSLRVLMGGVGLPQEIKETRFSPIAKLEEELDGIAEYVDSKNILLNESFTSDNLRTQLTTGSFSAIHWKTHGVFSSDPNATFLVAYQEQISAQDLNRLIQLGSKGGVTPLELVVLSACETAQGDQRAVLGLAGLAARTGTRSVLSTLWTAQDTPNTEFMVRFYQALAQSDTSIAEALRLAQLSLIYDYGYTTPYIWANYMLIGNWS